MIFRAGEVLVENERHAGGIAGAPIGEADALGLAADDASLAVDPSLLCEEPRAGDAIVDVDHALVQLQTVAVCAAESGASAVVHVEHRNAAAGPILNAQIERARCGRRRPAVALDQKRRPLLRCRRIVGIAGRVEQAEGRFPARGREFHAFDPRKVVAEMQVGTIENAGRPLQHGVPTGPKIECHDAGGMVGRTRPKYSTIAHSAHRAEFRERRGHRRERFICQIQHREAAESPLGIGADDPLRPGESIGRRAERPLRQSELPPASNKG